MKLIILEDTILDSYFVSFLTTRTVKKFPLTNVFL